MKNGSDVVAMEHSREMVAESMGAPVLSDKHIQARVNMIQGAIRNVFKEGTHYGTIPGTPKPTLYKPGAEQLLVMFRIAPKEPQIQDLSTEDCFRYRIIREGMSQVTGGFIASGCGECSSDEEKYKWRKPVCNEEWEEAQPDRRREVWRKFQGKPTKVKQVRTNLADVSNTILKMADKRALVAMTLLATGASDAFAQDIEDLPEEVREAILENNEKKSTVEMPRAKEHGASFEPENDAAEPAESFPVVTREQSKQFWLAWQAAHKSRQSVQAYLKKTFGIERDTEIPADRFEESLSWAKSK